jgi:hypothetical protein
MAITLTRQQLYDRVWTDPIHTLSKEFGLSDAGLEKPSASSHSNPAARLLGETAATITKFG